MARDQPEPERSGKTKFKYTVNGEPFTSDKQVVQARDVLQKARLLPPSEHVLIGLNRPGSKAFGIDADVDFEESKEFRASLSDRSFNFMGDEVGYAWANPSISEPELRDIMGVAKNHVLYLDRDDGDELLTPTSNVNLSERGTEDIRSGRRLITVFYRDEPIEMERGRYTGAQLIERFGVPTGYVLDRVKPAGGFEEISPGDTVKVRDGMHFVSHPPKGQSS
jgi:hypothetical protein